MDTDNEYNDEDYSMMGEDQMPYGALQATQEQYFPSQPIPVDGHLWGFLQPCNAALKRIDFLKMNPTYTIGRGAGNDFLLEGFKVSNRHCKFTWDSRETGDSIVTIQDFSSNGTFVNMTKVGKNKTTIIRDGNELGFGAPSAQTQNEGLEDYRYVFRFVAAGIPRDGLHAHYDLGTELGKGSFANVYKAMHRATSKWFAVKMIQAEKIKKNPANHTGPGDAKKATAFAREISILEQLSHPNICQLKETFFHDSNISLVLELVEGGDLLDYILRHEGVKEPPAKHITYQICDALAYIHQKGIAHRDLKPENVLLTKDDPPVVKVADFGLAKVVDSLTVLRTMCGTPSYLAPEVVTQQTDEGYSHLVDSWSVGVIVFSMLTNTSPFIEDDTIEDLRVRIAGRQVDWKGLQRAEVSADGQSFIRRLLDPRPDLRMTLAAARDHQWLQGHGPIQPRALMQAPSIDSIAHDDSAISSINGDDNGMDNDTGDQINQDFQQMQLHQNGGLPQREGSRVLSRRSHVLSQAAENETGGRIPEPSWQMISNSQAEESAITENEAGPSTRGHKRKDPSVLTTMPEDEEWSEANGPPVNGGPRKKGRGTADVDPAKSAARSVRGTRAKKANATSSDDEPATAVRRSSRQTPQKPTRKN